jgi:SAM-dependent methyltransferase
MREDLFEQMARIENDHWWFVGRRRILTSLLQTLPRPDPLQVVEIGCGTGGNLEMLSRFGSVEAFESSDRARELAAARGIATVRSGELPDGIALEPASTGLVLLADVLEHVEDDVAALAAIRTLLAPGAHLVLTVPAHPFLWSEHDRIHGHHRRYTRRTLRDRRRAAGLRPIHLSHFNFVLLPPIAAVRIAQRVFPARHVERSIELPPPFLNTILRGVFSAERHVVARHSLPFGVSLAAMARREA